MPTTLTNGIQLPDKGSVDWYSSMQSNYNLIDTHLGNTDTHVTAEDKANWNSKQGSLSQAQLDAIAQVATNTNDIATLQSGKANASHTHSSSDITDIGDYATKQYVDNSISGLVDSAPNALDTLNELAAALNDDANFATTVTNALSNKANSADLATVATSGSYTDLTDKPTIPTNTSDLTNDSNFVDTSNSAVASGITSAKVTSYDSHIADTDIHVTTTDKTKWNNGVSQSYVLRYSSVSVTDNSTIAYSTLDNTDNIKSGDKIIDLDGKIFSIVSVDTANSTVTVGSALIDLALDANVVHTSGNETVDGEKTFTSSIKGYNSDSTQNTVSIDLRTSKVSRGNTSDGVDTFGFGFRDKNNSVLASISCVKRSTGGISEYHTVNTTDSSNNVLSESYSFNLSKDGNSTFRPETNDKTLLGTSTNNWKGVYATNYYYGSNNVEFSTKFVTTDTAQTITESKTFTKNVKIKNTDVTRGATTGSGTKAITFTDSSDNELSSVSVNKVSNGSTSIAFKVSTTDNTDALISSSFQFYIAKNGNKVINPTTSEDIALGRSSNKWSDVVTAKVNGVEPSSLSLPSDRSARIDISSYFTNTGTGDTNTYTVPANGYINLTLSELTNVHCFSSTSNNLVNYCQTFTKTSNSTGVLYVLFPVRKNDVFLATWYTTTTVNVGGAYFIPCQGNV